MLPQLAESGESSVESQNSRVLLKVRHGAKDVMKTRAIFALGALLLLVGCRSPGVSDSVGIAQSPMLYNRQIVAKPVVERVERQETRDESQTQVSPAGLELATLDPRLSSLESQALAKNPAVAEAAARVEALRGKWWQAGAYPNPVAGYSGSEIGNEGRAGQQGAFVSQEFVRGGKLGLNREVVGWEIERAERLLVARRQRVVTDVRMGYYDVVIAQRRQRLAEEMVNLSSKSLTATEARKRAKESSQPEVLQARVEADTARILADNSRVQLSAAWQRLAAVLGDSQLPRIDLPDALPSDLPEVTWEEARKRILVDHPLLTAARHNAERARWALQRASVEPIPNVDVQTGVQFDNASRTTIANLQVGLPLPLLNRNQGGIQQAQAEIVVAERAVERVELTLHRRLAAVYERYGVARQRVEKYASDILPAAKETLDLTSEGFRAGEFDFLQLLTAQRTYVQSNLAYLDALRELSLSQAEIAGLLLTESLEDTSE